MNKHGATIDVVCKRYGERPSTRLAFDKVYNEYYCFQFDLAVAIKGIVTEAKVQKQAYEDARTGEPEAKNVNQDNPVFTPEAKEFIKQSSKQSDKKQLTPEEVMNKISSMKKKRPI